MLSSGRSMQPVTHIFGHISFLGTIIRGAGFAYPAIEVGCVDIDKPYMSVKWRNIPDLACTRVGKHSRKDRYHTVKTNCTWW